MTTSVRAEAITKMDNLSKFFNLRRRYYRSINLERDLSNADSVLGYVLTPRSAEILVRILRAISSDSTNRAWTLTGAYGTGKSSFAHFLACLCGPPGEQARLHAESIAREAMSSLNEPLEFTGLDRGLVRAVVTAQREPLCNSIVKALHIGVQEFWSDGRRRRPEILDELAGLFSKVQKGKNIDPTVVLNLVQEIARASKSGLLIVLDELGKCLEFAAQNNSDGDLYLLQQLAELPSGDSAPKVFTLAILHQAFSEYAHSLNVAQRNEWVKIQGRFEDVPFTGSSNEMLRLIGQAIDSSNATTVMPSIGRWAKHWFETTKGALATTFGDSKTVASIYPLHPISAAVLPLLCSKYGQNDRSLFTLLTSDEPNSFACFLKEAEVSKKQLPTLKLDRIYDYWIDAAGSGLYSRPQLQRWVEIQGRVSDAHNLDPKLLAVLKTIGLLNLVSSGGHLRATRSLVEFAMCDSADDKESLHDWRVKIDELVDRRLVVYRSQLDELRIWEGSDFDIELAIQDAIQSDRKPLESMLTAIKPLSPAVAQRHSYKTGTLRYFEKRYLAEEKYLQTIETKNYDADGLIVYWLGNKLPVDVPVWTKNGKPLVLVGALETEQLAIACEELWALKKISEEAPELRTDGVARREVRQRLIYAHRVVDQAVLNSFAFNGLNKIWLKGENRKVSSIADFSSKLSDICDESFSSSPVLWNELINRRELTSQGAKARGELLGAMITNYSNARLNLEGYGPECTIYESILKQTGIHKSDKNDRWYFDQPSDETVLPVWEKIENFCLGSTETPSAISELYELLSEKPYGVKSGIIPILLAAVLVKRMDDVCIYKDGSFVPVLGLEHFELLVKDPSRFSVKHFVTTGLRAQVFKEIEELVRRPNQAKADTRNSTLLGVVKPLVQFAKQLPNYTRRTKRMSIEAAGLRDALMSAKQPDELMFSAIPEALGLSALIPEQDEDAKFALEFRARLTKGLRDLQMAYDSLLAHCKELLSVSFAIDQNLLRQNLSLRCNSLLFNAKKSPLESFISNAADEDVDDRTWLERVLMIIGDKPVVSWTDDDVQLFETGLNDFVRKFNNFEVLQKNLLEAPGADFDARRITLTKPSGQEVHRIVWIDRNREAQIADIVDEIIEQKLKLHADLEEAIISRLTERILQRDKEETSSSVK